MPHPVAKHIDLLGRRFGKLLVVEKLPERQDRYTTWRCRCDCGGEIIVNTRRLQRSTVTDCGCEPKPAATYGPIAQDLTGQRFGKLVAIRRVENRNLRTRWLCQCDCGNSCTVTTQCLKSGHTRSCGCQRFQDNSVRRSDLSGIRVGRLTALYATERRSAKGSVYWHCRCDCGNELDVTEDSLLYGNYRSCGCRKREIQASVGGTLTFVDNSCIEWLQSRKSRVDNTSGFRGVNRLKSGKWKSGIGLQGKRYHLGTFDSFDAAVEARLQAEALLHDGFVQAYRAWEARSADDPGWAEAHPFYFRVTRQDGTFQIDTCATDEPR